MADDIRGGDDAGARDRASGSSAVRAFRDAFSSKKVIFEFLDTFPYMISIFARDGTIVFLNQAGYKEVKIYDPSLVIGRYNILCDTLVLETLGHRKALERAFSGERIVSKDLRFPADRYNKIDEPFVKTVIQTVSCFPIWDEGHLDFYVAMVTVTTGSYEGKAEIVRVLEYMNLHWMDEFDREKLAKIANISPHHFTRVFKQHQGITPQDHYKQIKLKKLREKLLDPNNSITQAFIACGLDINGRYMQYFKEEYGMTPSEYRNVKMDT